jgi:hypothetical protein
VFGTLLNSTIRSEIPAKVPNIAPEDASTLIRSPEMIQKLDAVPRQAVIDSIALGTSRIFWCCAALMAIAVVLAWQLPEIPLKQRAGLSDALEDTAPSH